MSGKIMHVINAVSWSFERCLVYLFLSLAIGGLFCGRADPSS
jgi:hypothetical protein